MPTLTLEQTFDKIKQRNRNIYQQVPWWAALFYGWVRLNEKYVEILAKIELGRKMLAVQKRFPFVTCDASLMRAIEEQKYQIYRLRHHLPYGFKGHEIQSQKIAASLAEERLKVLCYLHAEMLNET